MRILDALLTILPLVFLAFAGFVIYFIFKILQFVITATNLYKKMIRRQDAMIKLLIDIRDNTKQFDQSTEIDEDAGEEDDDYDSESDDSELLEVCFNCGAVFTDEEKKVCERINRCPKCGKSTK